MASVEQTAADELDAEKRWFLTKVASVAGIVGAGLAVTPFMASMAPSARAQAAAAPVEVDISKLEPGQLIRVMWRGKPVWILKRTDENLKTLNGFTDILLDPLSKESEQPANAANEVRSIRPEVFVAVGLCTHLGCSPNYRPEVAPADLGADWRGGFFCPCHGSRFDLAGRVYKGVPAPRNLEIPPHVYLSETRLLIGSDQGEAA
ncbi:ubiquinol-cytochrome c reductase iron-sulfur subunit [Candidatus Methylospira mobilis]|uniref:Ubiquinol-cytochrome c reductase iron-sulfur subunit n=1 Tax=Candidatus Methylospira mobilis TaxID=1808979 RepID=A0A5Q0BHK1_9GAMM|nr:ubiquinol-cytochrome c reductase iron-sulfur subunit [Candidatus Methylospira mobilis]QFY43303.1 ubiquinol-cytochrome c reductase iron-sulfur subunit [Candidatus Methylospira mobilis]